MTDHLSEPCYSHNFTNLWSLPLQLLTMKQFNVRFMSWYPVKQHIENLHFFPLMYLPCVLRVKWVLEISSHPVVQEDWKMVPTAFFSKIECLVVWGKYHQTAKEYLKNLMLQSNNTIKMYIKDLIWCFVHWWVPQTGYKKAPCLLIFVILESKIFISVIHDPLLFQFVNCVRDPPLYDTLYSNVAP